MTTLHELGVTPSHLTPAAQDLALAIRKNSCAWRYSRGWSPKGKNSKIFQPHTADKLIGLRLAMILTGKGVPRLVLTAAGEEMAKLILEKRQARKSRAA